MNANRISQKLVAAIVMMTMIWMPTLVSAEVPSATISGLVVENARPIARIAVYAYRLGELVGQDGDFPEVARLTKVVTDAAGRFLFEQLPAGHYQVVVHKAGFLPGVVQVIRETAATRQVIEMDLIPQESDEAQQADTYWLLQEQVAEDVLRQLEIDASHDASKSTAWSPDPVRIFRAEVEAIVGSDDTHMGSEGMVRGGGVDVIARVGGVEVGIAGSFERFDPAVTGRGPEGSASAVDLVFSRGSSGKLKIQARSDQLMTPGSSLAQGLESSRVSWSQDLGPKDRYVLVAHVLDENPSYVAGSIAPRGTEGPRRTVTFEGGYDRDLSQRTVMRTGLRVREQTGPQLFPREGVSSFEAEGFSGERVEAFIHSSSRLRPSILVDYGFLSSVRNGEVIVSPQTGVVLQLADWQIGTLISGQISDSGDNSSPNFLTTHYSEFSNCEQSEEFCGKLFVSRTKEDNFFSVGLIHRQFGDTLRLRFSDGFFRNLESLYVVPGDRLPELQVAVSGRISRNILARLQSNVASGGGGIFYAADSDLYLNEVRYIVTSIDTQFQSTSTGIFLGFHHLQQNLSPLAKGLAEIAQLNAERLQLKVTQDLNALFSQLPADWALQLDMELAKGTPGAEEAEEISSRILGSLRVKLF